MYIVKAIVESSGGKIWFESAENEGTTFHVLLPLAGMPKKGGTKGLG
jgi:signal transduction histidine kinase